MFADFVGHFKESEFVFQPFFQDLITYVCGESAAQQFLPLSFLRLSGIASMLEVL